MKLLFTTDGHLSTKRPIARKEESDEIYIEHQFDKRIQMFEYAKNNNIKCILDGGDFFQYWKMDNSNDLIIRLIKLFEKYDIQYYCNIGNHDLPFHNLVNINQSLLGLIKNIGLIKIEKRLSINNLIVDFYHFSDTFDVQSSGDIAVIHENIFQNSVPPYMKGFTCKELIEKLPNYRLYLCGHNHEQFIWSGSDKIVINGGSLMRLSTKQMNFKPAFWEISIDDEIDKPLMKIDNISIKRIYIDIIEDLITDEHLKKNIIETFVQTTENFEDIDSFDFRKDVENAFVLNNISESIKMIVRTALQ